MDEPDLHELISAAKAYEELHVPALFQQWTEHVLNSAHIIPGQRVLDVACGTGVLARAAMERVGNNGYVTGIDPAPGMLAVAEEMAPSVDWREGVAESLPYPDQAFDVVVSQFGLMFFRDRRQALLEMRRVLIPGGKLAVAVWDALENSAAYPIEVSLLERIAGPDAADALRAPFVLGDRNELTELFESADMTPAEITTHTGTARFPSIHTMVEADLRGWLPVMGVELDEQQIQDILEEADHALQEYVTLDGEVMFDSPAHIIVATRH